MTVYYEWADDDKTIANIYIKSPWTWEEYTDVTKALMITIRDMKYPCATVADVTDYGSLPTQGNALNALLSMEKLMPENLYATVLVGTPYAATVFINILLKLRPRMQRISMVADTIEEAHTKILAQKKLQWGDSQE